MQTQDESLLTYPNMILLRYVLELITKSHTGERFYIVYTHPDVIEV